MKLNESSYEKTSLMEALTEFLILAGITFLPFDVLLVSLHFFFFNNLIK